MAARGWSIQIQFIMNVHVPLKPVAALKVGLIDSWLSFKECISNASKELHLLTLHNVLILAVGFDATVKYWIVKFDFKSIILVHK